MVAVNPSTISFEKDLLSNERVRVRYAHQPSHPKNLLVYINKETTVAGKVGEVPEEMQKYCTAIHNLFSSRAAINPILDWGVTPEGYLFIVSPRPKGKPLIHVPLTDSKSILRWLAEALRVISDLKSVGLEHSSFSPAYDFFIDDADLICSFPAASFVFTRFDSEGVIGQGFQQGNYLSAIRIIELFLIEVETRAPSHVRDELVPQLKDFIGQFEAGEITAIQCAERLEKEKFLHETMLYTAPEIVQENDKPQVQSVVVEDKSQKEFGYSRPDEHVSDEFVFSDDDDFDFSDPDEAGQSNFSLSHIVFKKSLIKQILHYFGLFLLGMLMCVLLVKFLISDEETVYEPEGDIIALENTESAPTVDYNNTPVDPVSLSADENNSLEQLDAILSSEEDSEEVDANNIDMRPNPLGIEEGALSKSQEESSDESFDSIETEQKSNDSESIARSQVNPELAALLKKADAANYEARIVATEGLLAYCATDSALVLPKLRMLLADSDNLVRGFAVHAYANCAGKEAKDELEARKQVETSEVVLNAINKTIARLVK